jgi:hypothetical protein
METSELNALRKRLCCLTKTRGVARQIAQLAQVSPSTINRIQKRGFAACDARVLMSVHAAVATLEREEAVK